MAISNPKRQTRIKLDEQVEGAPTSHMDPPLHLGPRKKSIYESTCPNCNQPIGKGDSISHAIIYRNGCQRKRWIHVACNPAQADDAPIGEHDEKQPGIDELARQQIDAMQRQINEQSETIAAAAREFELKLEAIEARTPRKVIVKVADKPEIELDERLHPAFDRVLRLAVIRKNIFLPGPTGCGKTHLAAQVAKALGLKFGMVSCSAGMSEGQLTGRLLPVGKAGTFEYIISEFVKCFETGGVFLLDEIDAADENVLLVINAALANGKMAVSNRPKKPYAERHPDFICIAAANTWGTGADREYVGRNQLDGATLDRFRFGCTPMDYDEAMERQLVGNDELHDRLLGYRKAIAAAKLKRPMSTRFMLDARDGFAAGFTFEEIDEAFFSGWRVDDIIKVKGN